MRTFDLTPFYRSTIGFDRLFSMLDQVSDSAPGYPPYNIERTGENAYRISVAVSGFAEAELSIVAKENTLTIKGEKSANENATEGETPVASGNPQMVRSGGSIRRVPVRPAYPDRERTGCDGAFSCGCE